MNVSVLILTTSMAIPMPGWLMVLGVMIAAAFGALAQWLVSARSKKQIAQRIASVAVVGVTAGVVFWSCWGMPDWLCFVML